MATAKATVKETLLGTTIDREVSVQTKATFDRNARQDEGHGEKYMTEEDFVNAIAPTSENYVIPSTLFVARRRAPPIQLLL